MPAAIVSARTTHVTLQQRGTKDWHELRAAHRANAASDGGEADAVMQGGGTWDGGGGSAVLYVCQRLRVLRQRGHQKPMLQVLPGTAELRRRRRQRTLGGQGHGQQPRVARDQELGTGSPACRLLHPK